MSCGSKPNATPFNTGIQGNVASAMFCVKPKAFLAGIIMAASDDAQGANSKHKIAACGSVDIVVDID